MISNSFLNITPQDFPAHLGSDPTPKEMQLYATVREFEAVLTASILKQGLKSAAEMSGEKSSNTSYMNIAHEQLANFIGRQGILGVADTIYQQLAGRNKGQQ